MYPRELSLAGREILRRLVREAIAKAIETSPEGELVDTLALELGHALRREGRALTGLTPGRLVAELGRGERLIHDEPETATTPRPLPGLAPLAEAESPDEHERVLHEELRASLGRLFAQAAQGGLSIDELHEATVAQVHVSTARTVRALLGTSSNPEEVEVLRRRLEKLNRSLAASEQTVRRLTGNPEELPGLRSGFRNVQGLDSLSPHAARKRMLLTEVYRANLKLRDRRDPA